MSTPAKQVSAALTAADVEEQFLCPIGQAIMTDPVMASDGHTYDRKSIQDWIDRNKEKGPVISPVTNKPITETLIPNRILKDLIGKFHSKKTPQINDDSKKVAELEAANAALQKQVLVSEAQRKLEEELRKAKENLVNEQGLAEERRRLENEKLAMRKRMEEESLKAEKEKIEKLALQEKMAELEKALKEKDLKEKASIDMQPKVAVLVHSAAAQSAASIIPPQMPSSKKVSGDKDLDIWLRMRLSVAENNSGRKGFKENPAAAFAELKRAVEGAVELEGKESDEEKTTVSILNYELGMCYNNGYGTAQDFALAAYHFQQSYIRGNPDAAHMLGIYHRGGYGGLIKSTEVVNYYFTIEKELKKTHTVHFMRAKDL